MILNGCERICSYFFFNFKYYMYKKCISCVVENKINKKKISRFLDIDGIDIILMMCLYCICS